MNQKIEESFEYKLAKEQTIVYLFDSITKDYVYKEKDINLFYDQIGDIVPDRKDFFISWFKAFVAVAELNFESSADFYKAAFTHIEKAEEYTGRFVQQAFTFFMYAGDKKTALKIWDAGVAKKLVAPLDDRFFMNFNPKEQFWTQFAPVMFKDQKSAEEKAVSDYKKKSSDNLLQALSDADFKSFKSSARSVNLSECRISGISILYHAIQFKGTLAKGSQAYAEGMTEFRTSQLISSLDLKNAPEAKQNETLLTIHHQMKQMYENSGLGKIMFQAYYCKDDEIDSKIDQLDQIIKFIAENTENVDSFKMNAGAAMSNTALYLAAELDDSKSLQVLLKAGAETDKPQGYARFSFKTKNGQVQQTEVPNTLIYRLINFKAWNSLKIFLTDYKQKAQASMTAKSEKCNVTPLVYLIMNMLYSAKNEAEFNKNKETVDELLPLLLDAGSKLDQNTCFGTARQLLGM